MSTGNEGLSQLNASIEAKRAEIAAAAETSADAKTEDKPAPAQEVAKIETKPEPPKIIPAKVIKRSAPKYPSRALKKGTEGWVQVKFSIDKKGVPQNIFVSESEPANVFDEAAIKSVKKWRFSPARNQRTGLPVDSSDISTKVQFRLN